MFALAQLRIPYNLVEIDILKGESRTPQFLAMNPNGRVPLLEVAPGRHLPLPGHDHFSILEELARPGGAILGALRELAFSTS